MALEESNWVFVEDIDMEEAHKEPSTVDLQDRQILKLDDFPERMQIYYGHESMLEGLSIYEESTWIHNQLEPVLGPICRDDIFRFLKMHHSQKLDIPFIAMYRREECPSLLKDPEQLHEGEKLVWHKKLWSIQEFHKKWLLFQNQKRVLQIYYNKRFEEEFQRGFVHDNTRRLFESIMKSLMDAESGSEVEDVNTKFRLHFPGGEGQTAIDISSDPDVRKYVRRNYFDFVEVSVSSMEPGLNMDCQRKPLNSFEDAQWLLVQKAEEDNLVQVTIKLPEESLNKLIGELSNYYLSSNSEQQWNEQQRMLVLRDAVSNFILPSMEKEARSLLVSRAKNWLLMECGKALWNRVSMAPPYKQNQTAPRVMACCWGPGEPATTLVMLDSCGELLDVLCIGTVSWENLTWTIPIFDEPTRLLMKRDGHRIVKFVREHRPGLVVIGAANMSCAMLREQLMGIEAMLHREKLRSLKVVYGDETLACLYENSQVSIDQLPGQSGIVRRAVALGRYLQNPLAMVATLCGPGREILEWKRLASPFDDILSPNEKYAMIEQVMVDVTNQVGLDINLATCHEWLFAPLQFISGLGPIKAATLQQSLVRSGEILARRELATLHGLGRSVYLNAVGFLRIRQHGMANSTSALLDDTRIHTESYLLAQEMIKVVYDDQDATELQRIRDQPSYLEKLDIEAYAKSKNLENKMQTLCSIRRELIQGFQDGRKKYEDLNADDKFYTMTGTTCDTLCEGSIVHAIVRRSLPQITICTVGAGLISTLGRDDFRVDGRKISDLSQVLKVGDTITCKIKSLDKKRLSVELCSL